LAVMIVATICGEDNPSGMAEWAKNRTALLCEVLKVERRTMPHHSTYRRILEEVICVEEREALVSEVWSGKRYFGKQLLLAIDGKVLCDRCMENSAGAVVAIDGDSTIPCGPVLQQGYKARNVLIMLVFI
jgi:DDE_Tnp_1-associated